MNLEQALLDLIPSSGQLPYILLHQVRRRNKEDVTWGDMQVSFDQLYDQGEIYPKQKFSKSIIKRVYKFV